MSYVHFNIYTRMKNLHLFNVILSPSPYTKNQLTVCECVFVDMRAHARMHIQYVCFPVSKRVCLFFSLLRIDCKEMIKGSGSHELG